MIRRKLQAAGSLSALIILIGLTSSAASAAKVEVQGIVCICKCNEVTEDHEQLPLFRSKDIKSTETAFEVITYTECPSLLGKECYGYNTDRKQILGTYGSCDEKKQ